MFLIVIFYKKRLYVKPSEGKAHQYFLNQGHLGIRSY